MFKQFKLGAHRQCMAIQYLCLFPIKKLYPMSRLSMILAVALLHMFDAGAVHVGFVVKKWQ
jgi:hypothetical protein